MSRLIFFTLCLLSFFGLTAHADCLYKMKQFNKGSTTLKIKIHPVNSRTIEVRLGKVSEADGSNFDDVLRYCAYTMHRLDYYISVDGKTLRNKCAITNIDTGAVNCSEVEPQEQAKQFINIPQ